jgi:acetyl-CoA synthetase
MRTVYGDHKRLSKLISVQYPGNYFTGDGCRRDEDGYYWITGRVDDVLNISGHRLGTAEVESAWWRTPKSPRPPWSAIRTTLKGRGFIAMSPSMPACRAMRDLKKDLGAMGAQGNWPHRLTRFDSICSRSAENPVGQDHAPHFAQNRRG